LAVLLIALGCVLRFLFLARKPFWFDECFSVEVARLRWSDFARLMWRREANMSLYYLILRAWLHLGSSPFFIRSLSVLFSIATLPALFWLASRLFDRRVAILALALMSCNAYHIRYAQEARSYSLFVLLAVLSSGFFVALARATSRRNFQGYILASVLAAYAHLYALLLLAAQWLAAPGWHRAGTRGLRRAWAWIGVACLPLIVFAAKTGAGPIRWISRPGIHDVIEFAQRLAGNDGWPLLLLYAVAGLFAIAPLRRITGMLRADAVEGNGRELWGLRWLLIWLMLPVAITLLLSLARPLFLGRYFIFCLPALVTLAAVGLAKVRLPWLLGVSLAAMLLLSLHGTFSYYEHDFDLERDGSQDAVNYILNHAQPGDGILFHIAEARVPYEFFQTLRVAVPSNGVPEIFYPVHGERLNDRDFTGKPTAETLRAAGRYLRVWVVLMSNGAAGHPDATTLQLQQVLRGSFPREDRLQFPQVDVRLYSRF